MTMISYAQNHEDILLWRVLSAVKHGFYVDVGANDPDVDSVTKLFYEEGWSGINIEPIKRYAEQLKVKRPRDINIQCCIGNKEDTKTFYEVIGGTGLSCLDPKIAQEHARSGWEMQTYQVNVQPLNDILEKADVKEIHFLKIDVEGHEREVLESIDLSRYRPWIIIVEAIDPVKRQSSYSVWESMLEKQNYNCMFFDGLNRYYLASEKHYLTEKFSAPVNCIDDYIGHAQYAQEGNATELRNQLHQLHYSIAFLTMELEKTYSSFSWKITKPIRGILRLMNDPLNFINDRILKRQPLHPKRGLELNKLLTSNRPPRILIDVTRAAMSPTKTGICRVVNNVTRSLASLSGKRFASYPITILPCGLQLQTRYAFGESPSNKKTIESAIEIADHDILLMLDLTCLTYHLFGNKIFEQVREKHGKIYTVVYDLIPLGLFYDYGTAKYQFKSWFEKAITNSDGLICISRTVANDVIDYITHFRKDLNFYNEKLHIGYFYQGTNLVKLQENKSPNSALCRFFETNENKPVFLMVGTLSIGHKNQGFVLDAFDALWSEGIDVALCVCGGIGWDGKAIANRMENHPEFNKRLFWLNDGTDLDLAYCYRHASALISASKVEGFGLPIVEAAQYGLPIICSDIPVFHEITADSATFFSLQAPDHLVTVLKQFIAKPEAITPTKVPILTWEEATEQLLEILLKDRWYYTFEKLGNGECKVNSELLQQI